MSASLSSKRMSVGVTEPEGVGAPGPSPTTATLAPLCTLTTGSQVQHWVRAPCKLVSHWVRRLSTPGPIPRNSEPSRLGRPLLGTSLLRLNEGCAVPPSASDSCARLLISQPTCDRMFGARSPSVHLSVVLRSPWSAVPLSARAPSSASKNTSSSATAAAVPTTLRAPWL